MNDNVLEWRILSQNEEERLDNTLIKVLEGKTRDLLEKCRTIDSEAKQLLLLSDFLAICRQEFVTFTDEQLNYI